ncbi:MAG TPA: phage tail sheath subtilisin-like domain-containing protein [Candidatus Enterenecus stercoripullorum]|nr:phage tail sheath subtilisin-like domain-containing protein [Candidatus Enterenecus stercoripullorum]
MANLNSPSINVTFTELGISAINRGSKGTVAVILRDAAEVDPVALTQASQIPNTLGADNQAYLRRTFLGYVNPPKKVIVYVTDEEDTNLAQALAYMATQDFDYLVGPADCTSTEAAAIATWVDSQRTNNGAKYKAVLPNQASDKYPIINFAATGMTDGTETYTTAEYCSRMAGLIAGTPMKISATYAPLPELTDVDRLTKEELSEAVNAGKLVLKWDGRQVKVDRAVNSFVTTTQGMLDSFKKIKIVEIMDLIRTDVTATAEDSYIGKYANTYDNKLLLVTAIRGYFMGLEQDDLVQPGYTVDIDVTAQEQWLAAKGVDTSEMTEQEIRAADTGTNVFLLVQCKILDAIEDIDINIEI